MTRSVSLSRLCLLGFLLGVVGLALASGWFRVEAEPKPAQVTDAPAPIRACRPANGPQQPVIQAGRELATLQWIEPLREGGVGGLSVQGVALARDHLQLGLEGGSDEKCSLPPWSGPAGVLAIGCGELPLEGLPPPEGQARHGDFVSAWWRCDRSVPFDGQAELESLVGRYDGDIWGVTLDVGAPAPSAAAAVPEGWAVPEPISTARLGIVGPAAEWLGLLPSTVMQCTLLLGALVSLVAFVIEARRRPETDTDEAPPSREAPLVTGIALLVIAFAAVGFRIWLVSSAGVDSDENVWGRASQFPVFADDHDAWIHPPLYRLLQHQWSALVFERAQSSIAWLRGLSLVASMLAVVGLAALAWRRRSPLVAFVALCACVFSPTFTEAGLLARPYGLTAMLFVAVLLALYGDEEQPAWPSASLAAGLVLWCDLVYGATALLLIALEMLRQKLQRKQRLWPIAVPAVFAMFVWSAPLVPGALHSVREGSPLIHGKAEGTDAAPDLRPENPVPARATALLSASGWGLGAPVGVVSSLGLLVFCVRRRRLEPAMLIGTALLTAVVAAASVELRPRNLLFVPMTTAVAWLLILRRRHHEDDSS